MHQMALSLKLKIIFLKLFLRLYFIFRERGEGREKEWKKNMDVREKHQLVASPEPPTGDLASNPGLCPEGELNRQHFSSQASAQPTGPHQPGLKDDL